MTIEVQLPNIGEGVESADIADILVAVGDTVSVGQTLMELETDKAVVELPSSAAGKIEKILVSPGATVQVGEVLMLVSDGKGESGAKSGSDSAAKKEAPQQPAAKKEEAAEQPAAAPQEKPEKSEPKAEAAAEAEIVEGVVEFQLPPLGEGVDSADVAEILVSEGDVVQKDDVVMELETEKAVVELPCPHSGKIKKIHIKEGDSVNVGSVVMTIEATSKVSQGSAPAKPSEPAPAKKQEAAPKAAEPAKAAAPASKPAPQENRQLATSGAAHADSSQNGDPVPAAPSTRRMARQLGVDLREVRGSGRGGRITQEDVQNYVRDRMQKATLPARSQPAANLPALAGGIAPPPLPDFSRFGLVEREKMNKIARTAAENLTVSWNVIPHVTQHDRIDITDLEAARKRFSAGMGKNGPKVTMTAIIIKALTKCLQAYPKFNSSLDPETQEIVFKKFYNIGCAVDTPHGLVVPVIKDCDKKSILEIARDLGDLAEKARDRKLPIDSMQGATCTVTNLGGIGGVGFTPIVNYPEVCILGMSRGQQELRLNEGKVEERLMLPLSLSYDHRVINGADAARFVVTLGSLLSDPFQLLTTV
ncbi:dihydrolipoyllysine-residue acetyltransferase [Planctomicrobium sp. SH664]|uniref:dihydrolipoyllysine-residue acetyltransferase n=1 Tax=Planctomicrobium sp. SH664 TaxID=3448125 RepID=UPI003F5B90AA